MEDELFDFWVNEVTNPSGWDFFSIKDRMTTAPLDWSYTSEILYPMRNVSSLLDIETGGGEFLSNLTPLPSRTVATEVYEANLVVAKNNLEPLGVEVVDMVENNKFPFADSTFELVINRHGMLDCDEIYRVLDKEGYFITQQVGSADQQELNQLLLKDETQKESWNMGIVVNQLRDAGFEIIKSVESRPLTRFFDIGALIFYLQKVSWQVDDFSIDKYRRQLKSIHSIITQKGSIESLAHRFFISAFKP